LIACFKKRRGEGSEEGSEEGNEMEFNKNTILRITLPL
jgi:hypothetical protein